MIMGKNFQESQFEKMQRLHSGNLLPHEEIQTLRAKVASADVLVEALRTVMNEAEEIVLHDTNFVAVPFEIFDKMEDEYEALTTYDKISEVKHEKI